MTRDAEHRRLRVALMGTRGIPARYGGFETFYENLGARLADRGHRITVYNRPSTTGHRDLREFRGVELRHLPSIHSKHLDTPSHTALSVADALVRRFDIAYMCGIGNVPFTWIPRLVGTRVVLNVDSADWRRAKWGRFAKTYLRSAERWAGRVSDLVIADNPAIRDRYLRDYGIAATYIPYGAIIGRDTRTDTLDALGLRPRNYILWVGRLEPETRVEELMEAYRLLGDSTLKLVIVGGAPFADQYRARLKDLSSSGVMFVGPQWGDQYRQLSSHAFAYVQTSPTSGTSPALLDQMGAGNAVIARGTDTNAATVGEAGLTYAPADAVDGLAAVLRRLIDDPDLTHRLRSLAERRVRDEFSWDSVVDRYESLFMTLVREAKDTGRQ